MSTMCFIIIDTIEICYFKYNVVVECFITIVSLALLVLIKKKWLALLVRLIWLRFWNEKENWKKKIKLDVLGCVVYRCW